MFEKVNPDHPDKVADRIAGALVDYAYSVVDNPKIAVEVLIGHNTCHIIAETSVHIPTEFVKETVERISKHSDVSLSYVEVPQDFYLARNQENTIHCGDNGIFKGTVVTDEQKELTEIAEKLYNKYDSDGKYILSNNELIICQSMANYPDGFPHSFDSYKTITFNPLGYWTGGVDVDSGATNRKLGSDMGDSVTGGGLHGKDLSKADVSVNIYAWLKAQEENKTIDLSCAIGDDVVSGIPYGLIVEIARDYIKNVGGFEKFAEWGLIRPADQSCTLFD